MHKILISIVISISIAACASTGRQGEEDETRLKQAQVNTALGQEYMDRGQYEIALDKLKKALGFNPGYAPAHTVLAVLYEQLGEAELAKRHYLGAVQAAPANGDVNNNYGVYLCKSGDAPAAEKYFIKATEDPFYRTPAVALANAGSCFIQGGHLDKAEKYLRQSLEYDAEFADALLAMANVNLLRAEHFQARAFLQRFEGVSPVTPESLVLGWRIETGRQNEKNARDYRERLMNEFPGSPQAKELSRQSKQ
jgi:type IV pilus assembly protein PilF